MANQQVIERAAAAAVANRRDADRCADAWLTLLAEDLLPQVIAAELDALLSAPLCEDVTCQRPERHTAH